MPSSSIVLSYLTRLNGSSSFENKLVKFVQGLVFCWINNNNSSAILGHTFPSAHPLSFSSTTYTSSRKPLTNPSLIFASWAFALTTRSLAPLFDHPAERRLVPHASQKAWSFRPLFKSKRLSPINLHFPHLILFFYYFLFALIWRPQTIRIAFIRL